MASNPNPQPWRLAAYEAVRRTVTMIPPTDVTGWTFIINVRRPDETPVWTSTAFTIDDAALGVFHVDLSSIVTGVTLGVGDFLYDIWRTNAGAEKRLTWGELTVAEEQWQ